MGRPAQVASRLPTLLQSPAVQQQAPQLWLFPRTLLVLPLALQPPLQLLLPLPQKVSLTAGAALPSPQEQ
jgi:hypothetical protein